MSTPQLNVTQNTVLVESARHNIAKIEDFSCLPETSRSESLEMKAENTSAEVSACSNADAVDPACNGWSQSAKGVEYRRRESSDSARKEPEHPGAACSTADTADDGRSVSGSSCSTGRESYLKVWTCTSSQPGQNATEKVAIFWPVQREVIKSDESSSPSPLVSPFDNEDLSGFCPPVPKKRTAPQFPASDQSTKTSQPSLSVVPSRLAPSPPNHGSELDIQVSISDRKADEYISDVSCKMTVASSSVLDKPAARESDSELNLLVPRGMGSPQPLSAEEEQMLIVSFQGSSGEVSLLPMPNISSRPQPRPRDPPRQPAVACHQVRTPPPPVQKRPVPLAMLTSTQKSPISTPTAATSPLDRVIAVGGVNVFGGAASAGLNIPKMSTSNGISCSPLASPSARTPPAPPPKHSKPSHFVYGSPADGDTTGDTTDDDLDSSYTKESEF